MLMFRVVFDSFAVSVGQDLTRRLGSTTAAVGEAPWEAKAITVIGCIKNTEVICFGLFFFRE